MTWLELLTIDHESTTLPFRLLEHQLGQSAIRVGVDFDWILVSDIIRQQDKGEVDLAVWVRVEELGQLAALHIDSVCIKVDAVVVFREDV